MNKRTTLLISRSSLFLFLCFSLLLSSVSYAGEKVASIKEGEHAPFDGTLFNTEAAARLLVDLEFSQEMCDIETQKKLELQEAYSKLTLDTLQASKDSLQMRFDETLLIRDEHILYLEKKISKPKISRELSFAIGVVAGVGLTIGAGYALGQAANP